MDDLGVLCRADVHTGLVLDQNNRTILTFYQEFIPAHATKITPQRCVGKGWGCLVNLPWVFAVRDRAIMKLKLAGIALEQTQNATETQVTTKSRRESFQWSLYEIIHIWTPHGKIWTQLIDLAPNVWLHSSVGRASHRYRGGHGFESHWSPDFFRLLLSNCLNRKINCDDHSSLGVIFIELLFHISNRFIWPLRFHTNPNIYAVTSMSVIY